MIQKSFSLKLISASICTAFLLTGCAGNYHGSFKAVCDPFGKRQSGGAENGLVGSLFYLPEGLKDSKYSAEYFRKHGRLADASIYVSELNVPTSKFSGGFVDINGKAVRTAGGRLIDEAFAIRFKSTLKLAQNDKAGYYQLAVLSDDGSRVRIDEGRGLRTLVKSTGPLKPRLSCAKRAIRLEKGEALPINVDYYQGDNHQMALTLIWREVAAPKNQENIGKNNKEDRDDVFEDLANLTDTKEDETDDDLEDASLHDSACGKGGRDFFFDPDQDPSAPREAWLRLIARGWRVIGPENYVLPKEMGKNPCVKPDVGSGECFTERFTQPAWGGENSVDILFVTDSVRDHMYGRSEAADGVGALVSELGAGVDYNVAVILGHGGLSRYSGKLWHRSSRDSVLRSSKMSLIELEEALRDNLRYPAHDGFSADGMEGLFSLSKALKGGRLNEIREKDFFRKDAALVVVFVSSGTDLCTVDSLRVGYGVIPYFARKDCKNVSIASVLGRLRKIQDDRSLVIAAFAPKNYGRYSNGYRDLARLSGGLVFDLTQITSADSYRQIARKLAPDSELRKKILLSRDNVEADTIEVIVDGRREAFSYDPLLNEVMLKRPGRPGSEVIVNYCRKLAEPSPAPSPEPIPTVVPSPAPVPEPTQEPEPIPEPTQTPTPTPTVTPPCEGPGCGGGDIGV